MLKSNWSRWIAFASSLLLLAAIMYVVTREQSFAALIEVWARTDRSAFLLAILIMICILAGSAWRVKIIAAADGLTSIDFLPLFRIQLISQFVAHGAPISALSDLAKAAMMKLRFSLPTWRSVRIIVYERLCSALGAVVVGLFTAIMQLFTSSPRELVIAQLVLWGAGCVGIAILVAIGGLHVSTGIRLLDWVVKAILDLGVMLRRPAVVGKLLLVSILQLPGLALVFIVLAQGMHMPASELDIMLFMPLIFFVSSLPVFYQGWGGREAVVIATIGSVGQVTSAEAIALSVAFGVVVFLASLPGALFWIMRPSMRKAIRMEVEQA